ncbi:MAG TPA: hypothetical protein VMR98_04255 [Candidatus Polarisedimenticolaceae bacterium]|nr:hypothetical protein [Candidatus Polarisedimenticolaceae bacterium]
MYPEWIQEQLDKIAAHSSSSTDERLAIRLAAVESRIIHHIGRRFDRLEAKLDYLVSFCETEEA